MDQAVITAHAYRVVIDERIHELYQRRHWYATHLGWIPEQRTEDMAELRLLVGLARKARALAAPATAPSGVGYHDWQAA